MTNKKCSTKCERAGNGGARCAAVSKCAAALRRDDLPPAPPPSVGTMSATQLILWAAKDLQLPSTILGRNVLALEKHYSTPSADAFRRDKGDHKKVHLKYSAWRRSRDAVIALLNNDWKYIDKQTDDVLRRLTAA